MTEQLQSFLRQVHLFENLSQGALTLLVEHLIPVSLPKGEFLFKEGEPGDDLFIVEQGGLSVLVSADGYESRTVAEVARGDCVGEMNVFHPGPRSASVRAESDCKLYRLERDVLRRLFETEPSLKPVISQLVRARFPKLQALYAELFDGLDNEAMQAIEGELFWRRLGRGQVLFRQGEPGDALFMIVHGRLEVLVDQGQGEQTVVAELGRGEWVGEMALLDDETRSATVTALRNTELLGLSREGFAGVMERSPEILLPLIRLLSTRLRQTNALTFRPRTPAKSLVVTLIPHAPLPPRFIETLVSELSVAGSVIAVDEKAFDAVHGEGAANAPYQELRSANLNAWLLNLEEEHSFILYIADANHSEWTSRCLTHSDRILYSVDPAQYSPSNQLHLADPSDTHQIKREVLFWHQSGSSSPLGTAGILREFGTEAHHHLRVGRSSDIARLARFLMNRPVGLVMSGGGSRGLAHIGVYRALSEAGIEIDCVSGTSMGSFITAMIAADRSWEETREGMRRILVDRGALTYTLPLVSLMSSAGANQRTEQCFDDRDIEDLWLRFFCCATNLTTSQLLVQRTGSVASAIRASTAVPGIFPPVFRNGEILVDGGVLDNIPIGLMANDHAGPIIGCDVSRSDAFTVDPSLETVPNPFSLLFGGRTRQGKIPSIGDILIRTMSCTSYQSREDSRKIASLYLEPPVSQYTMLEMNAIDDLIEVGYRYASEELARVDLSILKILG